MKIKLSWPIGIIVIYSLFLITIISFLIFTRFNQADLVSEDYYQKEIKYQKQIDRIKRANKLSNPLQWKLLKGENKIYLEFPEEANADNLKGEVYFFRPSDSGQDFRKNIDISKNNDQFIDIKHLAKGYWRIKILWSVNGVEFFTEDVIVL